MKRFALALVTLLTAIGLTLAVAPAPAQAAYGGDCTPGGYFCLYQWTLFGSPTTNARWQTSINNIFQHPNGCLTIPPAVWANGDPVNDNSGSMQFIGTAYWHNYNVKVFNWTGCNPGGGYFILGADTTSLQGDLHDRLYTVNSPGYSAYHSITSIQISFAG